MKSKTSSSETSLPAKRQPKDFLVPGAKLKKDWQPTPEQKKAGRERKKQAQKIMDDIITKSNMSVPQLKEYLAKNWNKMPAHEYAMTQYVIKMMNSDRFLMDWIDRHIGKAPQEVQHSGEIKAWVLLLPPLDHKPQTHTIKSDDEQIDTI